jgi:hypothetical protein
MLDAVANWAKALAVERAILPHIVTDSPGPFGHFPVMPF